MFGLTQHAAFVGLVFVTGCVPVISVPIRGNVAVGFAHGQLARSVGRVEQANNSPVISIRHGIYPLQLVPRLNGRRVDVGVNIGAEFLTSPLYRQSGYGVASVSVGAVPWQTQPDGRPSTRFLVEAEGSLLFNYGFGVGANLSASLEFVWFPSQGLLRQNFLGGVHGEGTIGVQIFGGVRAIDGDIFGVAGVGLTFRAPFVLGAWFPTLTPQ